VFHRFEINVDIFFLYCMGKLTCNMRQATCLKDEILNFQ
jgi:hypothetical protein